MYEQGQRCALIALGLEKTAAGVRSAVLDRVLSALLYPLGHLHQATRPAMLAARKFGPRATTGFLGTAPFLAPVGALAGGITGAAASNEGERGRGALRGALLGGALGGVGAGVHGALRKHLSKIPASIRITPEYGRWSSTKINPESTAQFKRIFGEAAGVAGLTGAGAGLLARKKEGSIKTALSPGAAQMLKRMAVGVGTGAGIGWLIAPRPEDRPRTAVLSGLADIPILAASQLPDVVHHLETTRPGFAAAMNKMRGVPSALKHVIMRR